MDLVRAVRRHAEQHYEEDGWDFLVECWSDAEIAEEIGDADSEEVAIRRCLIVTRILADQRREIQSTAW